MTLNRLLVQIPYPESPSTPRLKESGPTATKGMVFWIRVLKYLVLGPSGILG